MRSKREYGAPQGFTRFALAIEVKHSQGAGPDDIILIHRVFAVSEDIAYVIQEIGIRCFRPGHLGVFPMMDASVKTFKKIVSPVIFIVRTDVEFADVSTRIIVNTDSFFGIDS